jgi:hypothetical protein
MEESTGSPGKEGITALEEAAILDICASHPQMIRRQTEHIHTYLERSKAIEL